ncbi:MAG: bifunctional glycosyltransferase family 2/GtrA family protein [Fibromonadaceae bacterium]|jgi:glycosyltransferase involved in cell wall biosynthesis|nr:bifunctional glycosyltransferase family 2/GtrA family protein [Fibromonadaceae bacterium]
MKKLSLIIPCYNEENTIEACVEKVRKITQNQDIELEIVIVNDCSTDKSAEKLKEISAKYPEIKIFTHEKNRGKGAALRTGLVSATGDFIGIQDADDEYNPMEYLELLKSLIEDKADVVYGSRYLQPDTRRVLYFWHTWMNKSLTFVSNMFTNLDITDMETCYKLFKKEVLAEIAPSLKEERFGFEPEITCKVAQGGFRVYEHAISYSPRSYEEGKKIGWKDGVQALYCLLHYGAHAAPLPMQLLLYLFIGGVSLCSNMVFFGIGNYIGLSLNISIVSAFILAAATNYILCILILFRHNARWNNFGEFSLYIFSVSIMCGFDYLLTQGLIALSCGLFLSKLVASLLGFVGNFALRKWLVFPEKKKP